MEDEEEKEAGSLWTAAEREGLIEGVRAFLLHGPRRYSWPVVWNLVKDRLPGRSFSAAKQHFLKGRCRPELVSRAKGEGRTSGPWTAAESAILAAAVKESSQAVEARIIDWGYVSCQASALAGRSISAMGKYWRGVLSATPAAKAMLAEVAEAVVRQGAGAAAGAAATPLPPVTPFHMLHSLRSSGCLDEATVGVCWRAAVAATQGSV